MGIKGLTTFLSPLKNHGIGEAFVKIEDVAAFLAENPEENATLIIDGNSLIYHIILEYKLDICIARCGGAYWEFEKDAEEWLSKLKTQTLTKLVVYCDGLGEQQKSETHHERAINRANKIWSLSQSMVCGIPFVADDFIARMNMGLYIACLSCICQKLQIEFTCCHGEADLQIARVTLQNNYFACLSNDSDFFCLQIPYIPLTSVKFTNENSVSVELYKPQNIAKVLKLPNAEFLPHLSCLIGNDFFTHNDVQKLHEVLNISHFATSNKNIIYHIQSVLIFLQSFKTCYDLTRMLHSQSHKNDTLFEKYFRTISQYAVHIPALEFKTDNNECVYATARKQGTLFGLSLRLYHFKPEKDLIFRTFVPLQLIALSEPFSISQDIQQQTIVTKFERLRNKIIDTKLGCGIPVECEQLTTSGQVVWKHTTQTTPDFLTGLEQFLWIVGETTFSAKYVENMLLRELKARAFAILVLRAFARIEELSLSEKTAVLCHFYPQTKNIAMASMFTMFKHEADTVVKINTRTVQLVSLFEYCLCLCVDANLCCNEPFGNVLQSPSSIMDGQRLSGELDGLLPPELGDDMLQYLQDDTILVQCKYDSACRFTKCAKTHPGDVFGRCSYDGSCNRQDCSMRHLLQPFALETLCKFDGVCVHFEKCRFKHTLQTQTFQVGVCRFDGSCTRYPNCLFHHHKQHAPFK